MNKYKHLFGNTIIFAISSISTKLIVLLFLPLYTFYLSTNQYAITDLFNVVQCMLYPVLTCSIGDAVLRYTLDKRQDKRQVFTIGVCFSLFGVLAGIALIPVLKVIPQFKMFNGYYLYYALTYSLLVFNSLFSTFARAVDKIRLIAVNSIVGSLISAALNVLFIAVFHWSLLGYFWAVILGNAVIFLSYIIFGKFYTYLTFKRSVKKLLMLMLAFCVPMIPNSISWWINSSVDKMYLTALTTLSFVGLYSAASKVPVVIITVTSIFSQAWNLSAITEYESEDKESFYSDVYQLFRQVVLIGSILLIIFCKQIGHVLFQKAFFASWKLVPFLVMASYFSAMSAFMASFFSASKRTKNLFTTTLAGALVNIFLNYILIKKVGGNGAAVATCVSGVIVWVMRSISCRKFLKLSIDYPKLLISQIILLSTVVLTLMDLRYSIEINLCLFVILILVNIKDSFVVVKGFVGAVVRKT